MPTTKASTSVIVHAAARGIAIVCLFITLWLCVAIWTKAPGIPYEQMKYDDSGFTPNPIFPVVAVCFILSIEKILILSNTSFFPRPTRLLSSLRDAFVMIEY
jgi:hypothetical protein